MKKAIEVQNIIQMLHEAMMELKRGSKMHGGIEKVIYSVISLLTEEDKKLTLPVTVKRKIIKLIALTVDEESEEVKLPWYKRLFSSSEKSVKMPINEYRKKLVSITMDIVVFIHSYK